MKLSVIVLICMLIFTISCEQVKEDCVYCGEFPDTGYSAVDRDLAGSPDKDTKKPDTSIQTDAELSDELVQQDTELSEETLAEADLVTDADTVDPKYEEMLPVSGGILLMGCENEADTRCFPNEFPAHEVDIPAFELDTYEVTKGQYQACIDAGACKNDGGEMQFQKYDNDNKFCSLGSTLSNNVPVNCVTWFGAKAYCAWKGKRLPTEAEWERAARGTDGRIYPWGDEPEPDCSHVQMDNGDDWSCGVGVLVPVGSKPDGRGPYGHYDLAGSVWEWVEDDWHLSYNDPSCPADGSAWIDNPLSDAKVIRGASFMSSNVKQFRASGRASTQSNDIMLSRGFRCAQ